MTAMFGKWIPWISVAIQIATYLWLAWIILFSGYDRRIPVPYIATHIAFALNVILVFVALGLRLFQGIPSEVLIWALGISAPLVIAEFVLIFVR